MGYMKFVVICLLVTGFILTANAKGGRGGGGRGSSGRGSRGRSYGGGGGGYSSSGSGSAGSGTTWAIVGSVVGGCIIFPIIVCLCVCMCQASDRKKQRGQVISAPGRTGRPTPGIFSLSEMPHTGMDIGYTPSQKTASPDRCSLSNPPPAYSTLKQNNAPASYSREKETELNHIKYPAVYKNSHTKTSVMSHIKYPATHTSGNTKTQEHLNGAFVL